MDVALLRWKVVEERASVWMVGAGNGLGCTFLGNLIVLPPDESWSCPVTYKACQVTMKSPQRKKTSRHGSNVFFLAPPPMWQTSALTSLGWSI